MMCFFIGLSGRHATEPRLPASRRRRRQARRQEGCRPVNIYTCNMSTPWNTTHPIRTWTHERSPNGTIKRQKPEHQNIHNLHPLLCFSLKLSCQNGMITSNGLNIGVIKIENLSNSRRPEKPTYEFTLLPSDVINPEAS